jgi:hypothetical protein
VSEDARGRGVAAGVVLTEREVDELEAPVVVALAEKLPGLTAVRPPGERADGLVHLA